MHVRTNQHWISKMNFITPDSKNITKDAYRYPFDQEIYLYIKKNPEIKSKARD